MNKGDGVPNNDCWVKNIVFDGVAFTSRCIYRYRVVEKEKNTSAEATKTWSKPNYTWNESNTFVTAERYCKEDPVVMETEKASVSANVSRQATVKTMGVTVYTAAFKNPAFSKQTKTCQDIPLLTPISAHLPDGLRTVGEKAFANTALEAIVFSDNCEMIGSCAFAGCSMLTRVIVSSATTQIAEDAFSGCEGIVIEQ